jgi:serine/threonine protein phosphatase PrpC
VIPSERAHLFTAAITHPGMTGKSNEDRYAISAYRLDNDGNTPSVFAIVADGVGGHKAGEIAAEIAVNTISHAIAVSDGSNPQETLEDAIVHAGEAIQIQSTKDETQHGMGSTCVCLWVIGKQLYTASVGDSRIYLLRDGNIHQTTIDHTWVQDALDHGIIKPEQARNHPRSHIIRRYLGSKSAVVPDFRLKLSAAENDEKAIANQGMQLLPGDQLLLCSDGLSDLVEDHEILDTLADTELSEALTKLVEMANQRGGHDNITILGLRVPTQDQSAEETIQLAKKPRPILVPWMTCTIIVLLVLAIFLLGAASIWFFNRAESLPTPTATLNSAIPTVTYPLNPTEALKTNTPIPSETPIQPTLTAWPTNSPESQETGGS